jgi:hypothetical protein
MTGAPTPGAYEAAAYAASEFQVGPASELVRLCAVVDAVWPLAVAATRRQVAADLRAYAENYPPDVFRPDGDSRDAIGGSAMRHAYLNAARIAEGTTHTEEE